MPKFILSLLILAVYFSFGVAVGQIFIFATQRDIAHFFLWILIALINFFSIIQFERIRWGK